MLDTYASGTGVHDAREALGSSLAVHSNARSLMRDVKQNVN